MPLKLLKQFFAFITKDEFFLEIKSIEEIIKYAKSIKFARMKNFESGLSTCIKNINESEKVFILKEIWEMTQWLSLFAKKKCLLIIDEAQEMETAIFDGSELTPCKGSIADIIHKTHSLVMVSGSNVSMLVNEFLDYKFANRFNKISFTSLEDKHAKELIARLIKNGYPRLADDLLELVGGNPYYIANIIHFNMKYSHYYKQTKNFSSREGLLKAYDFEVLNSEGTIFDFWNGHLQKNREDLNRDISLQKGLTLQILYKVASDPKTEFYYYDLVKEFGIEEDIIVKKIKQLEHANLLKPMGISRFAYGFPDKVLPVIINKVYHELIIKGPNKTVAQQAAEDLLKQCHATSKDIKRVQELLAEAQQKVDKMEEDAFGINLKIMNMKKKVKAAKGKANLKKGIAKENAIRTKVREMLEKNEGIFKRYKLQGAVHSINLRNSAGTGCEIDIYATLTKKENKQTKKTAFLAETKDQKTIINLDVAKKFIASVQRAKNEYKLEEISTMFICTAGFRINAKAYLESFSVVCSTTFPPKKE